MTEFIPHHFEKLKTELLEVSGIKQIIPSDCKRLSADIYAKTHRQISETTLKRVFGFAYTQFKPSVFTVSALAEYCGYSGWKTFSQQCGAADVQQHHNSGWAEIIELGKKITGFTLQTVKSRIGIPYHLTVGRTFIDEHLEIFTDETYTGTILTAPEGYGKSTAICRWIDKQLKNTTNTDIFYFFNCNVSATHTMAGNLTTCLHTLLGIAPGNALFDTEVFETIAPKGKFYLIIDGINDCNYKKGDLQMLFNQLADIASLYSRYPWFKILLSMRSTAWMANRHILQNRMNQWFTGFMTDRQQAINVPLLYKEEIALLADLIEPLNNSRVDEMHLDNLACPLYLQYYYQKSQPNFSLNKVNILTDYQLTTEHILRRVYHGRFNDDKVLLLREIVNVLEYCDGKYIADKNKLRDQLGNYQSAYTDLLSSGILKQSGNGFSFNNDSHIVFANNSLLYFTIAEKLINDNKGQFDAMLMEHIQRLPYFDAMKLPVLKWCIYNMVTGTTTIKLNWLEQAELIASEKRDLMVMLTALSQNPQTADQGNQELGNHIHNPDYQQQFARVFGTNNI